MNVQQHCSVNIGTVFSTFSLKMKVGILDKVNSTATNIDHTYIQLEKIE